MLDSVIDRLIHDVLPSAAEYSTAEIALSRAYGADATEIAWASAARHAKRRAELLAVAVDGLTDRYASERSTSDLDGIRALVAKLCIWPNTEFLRSGCIERMKAVATGYRHGKLTNKNLQITSDSDVLAVGTPYGIDVYGACKYGGIPEVIVHAKSDTQPGQREQCVFRADAHVSVVGWMRFLMAQGATLPAGPYQISGDQVHLSPASFAAFPGLIEATYPSC
jgi:hypothetical protein